MFEQRIELIKTIIAALIISLYLCFTALCYADSLPSITLGELRDALAELEGQSIDNESTMANEIALMNKAISQLEKRDKAILKRDSYQLLLKTAPEKLARLESELNNFSVAKLPETLSGTTYANLQSISAQVALSLSEKRKRVIEIDNEIAQERSLDSQSLLDQLNGEYEASLNRPELANQEASKTTPSYYFHLADSLRLREQINALEQRMLSRDTRLQLLDAEQKLLEKQIASGEQQLSQLQNLLTDHRQSEADRLIATMRSTRLKIPSTAAHQREQANTNIELANEYAALLRNDDSTIVEIDKLSRMIARLEQRFNSVTEQLKITQLESSPEFGAALRQQRDSLINESSLERNIRRYEDTLTQARLAQFRIDSLRERQQQEEELDGFQESKDAGMQLTLNTERDKILSLLSLSYARYIEDLSQLLTQSQSIIDLNQRYADLLNRQLLWMPSVAPFSVHSIASIWQALPRALSHIHDKEAHRAIAERFDQHRWRIVFVLLAAALLRQRRTRFITQLKAINPRVGKVKRDNIGLTFAALALTLSLALPVPMAVFALSWALRVEPPVWQAISFGLYYGASSLLVILFVKHALRDKGLIHTHFRWSGLYDQRLNNHLSWFQWIFPSLLVFVLFCESYGDAQLRDGLGRLTFVFAVIAVCSFALCVSRIKSLFNPSSALHELKNFHSSSALYSTAVILPALFILMTLSLIGYHYTALQLANYSLQSAVIIIFAFFAYSTVRRSFTIGERRLALTRAMEKRALASADSAASQPADELPAVDVEAIDLKTISTQTNIILKMLAVIVTSAVLWGIWSELLFAFQHLDGIALWQVSEQINGEDILSTITLWDILLTVVVVVVTVLAARNIPGLLEIALLSQLPLAVGTNYAITTLFRYVIVITGSVIALQLLGAQWSKLQWLVAALSVGLGFGLQEIVANFVSGIVILFERPIRIGDTVTIGDQIGTVSRIRIRATTIIDWDRREIVIPNKTFITERLINWSLTDSIMRTIIRVGVAYGSDVKLTEKTLLALADTSQRVLKDPKPVVLFHSFGDSTLNFELRVFINNIADLVPVTHELNMLIDKEFHALGIEIAFPQRDIHFDSAKPIEIKIVDQ